MFLVIVALRFILPLWMYCLCPRTPYAFALAPNPRFKKFFVLG